jgi:hypothetical protein
VEGDLRMDEICQDAVFESWLVVICSVCCR